MPKDKLNKSVLDVNEQLLSDITELIRTRSSSLLNNILTDLYDFDISVLIDNLEDDEDAIYLFSLLNDERGSEVLLELSDSRREAILNSMGGEEISDLVSEMYSDDATDILSELDSDVKEEVLLNLDRKDIEDSQEVRELLTYDENTAGGIMAKEFISVKETETVNEAVLHIQKKAEEVDQFYNVWVTDTYDKLVGFLSLKRLILAFRDPGRLISEIMKRDVIYVEADVDQQEVANIFRSYDLVSLPVVDKDKRLIGKISIDDVMDVMEEEHSEDFAIMVGSDAEELEKKSPFQIAKLRLPWILATLLIEFVGGIIIGYYDTTLQKVILLTSFMPIISAISGNTGLQSAAIVVRALDTGNMNINKWAEPLARQFKTTLIIGPIIGIIIATIGYTWSHSAKFALTVGLSMTIAINLAGAVGTIFPIFSKKLGFDPAVTSGPFETAFQDIVGIAIFLTIATYLLT
jgi:magnesium transporter